MKNFKNKKLSPRSKGNKPGLKSKQSMSPFNI